MTQTQAVPTVAERSVRLGYNHGYRIDGDIACLNAEISLPAEQSGVSERNASLQLWACDQPYAGGSLSGIKVAEAPLALAATSSEPQRLQTETFARLPAGDREYAMVLVLAERTPDAREAVLDFANYPQRAHFLVPRLFGEVAVENAGGGNGTELVTLRVQGVHNPRMSNNLSGSLRLELWALPEAYTGGVFEGDLLAGAELGQLAGQDSWRDLSYTVSLTPGAAGYSQRVLMLREWTAKGYVTRDYRNVAASVSASVQPQAASQLTAAAAPQQHKQPTKAEVITVSLEPDKKPSSQSGWVSIQSAFVGELEHVRKLAGDLVLRRPEWSLQDLVRTQVRDIRDKALRRVRSFLGFGSKS